MHGTETQESTKRKEPRVDGSRARRRKEAQGEGHAPGPEGCRPRLEQLRGSGRHSSKKTKLMENLVGLNIWRRDLDNRQSLELH